MGFLLGYIFGNETSQTGGNSFISFLTGPIALAMLIMLFGVLCTCVYLRLKANKYPIKTTSEKIRLSAELSSKLQTQEKQQ